MLLYLVPSFMRLDIITPLATSHVTCLCDPSYRNVQTFLSDIFGLSSSLSYLQWCCRHQNPSELLISTRCNIPTKLMNYVISTYYHSSSSFSLRVRRFSCSLFHKVELVPPSLLWPSHVLSSFRSVSQCLSWHPIFVHPLHVL
jgi:hypothetical protein